LQGEKEHAARFYRHGEKRPSIGHFRRFAAPKFAASLRRLG